MYNYNAQIVNIVDGDTIDVLIDLGFYISIKQRIRLSRIDCPERFSNKGKLSTEFISNCLGKQCIITTSKTDKYGRYIGEVLVRLNDDESDELVVNLSDLIVEQNHGEYVNYNKGGNKNVKRI